MVYNLPETEGEAQGRGLHMAIIAWLARFIGYILNLTGCLDSYPLHLPLAHIMGMTCGCQEFSQLCPDYIFSYIVLQYIPL